MQNTEQATLSNTSLCMINEKLSTTCKSSNPLHPNSKWGNLAHDIYNNNTFQNRKFLQQLSILTSHEKYYHTTQDQIQNATTKIANTEQLSKNHIHQNSIWGKISEILYKSNTVQDRKFLRSLWNISSVEDTILPFNLENLSSSLPAIPDRKTRKRRTVKSASNKVHYLINRSQILHRQVSVRRENQITLPTLLHLDIESELRTQLTLNFTKEIWQFPTLPCQSCDKLIYPRNSVKYTVTPKLSELLSTYGYQLIPGTVIHVCSRCKENMKRDRLSPQARWNNLELRPIPTEISILSEAEVRLISQVKIFMKIYHLCKGRGQPAMKGLVIHFPQKVNEVIHQLPLSITESDIVVVAEDFTGIDSVNEFKIRPREVYEALDWLKQHNKLYQNINIIQQDLPEIHTVCATQVQTTVVESIDLRCDQGYTDINGNISILRASTHQGHEIFSPNHGRQYMAMAAAFLGFCHVESPFTWTRQTLDQVLMCGNQHYTLKRASASHDFLATDEVTGVIQKIFNSINISMQIVQDLALLFPVADEPPRLQGSLNKYRGNDLALVDELQYFISNPYSYAILTSSCYTMGLYKDEHFAYLFDSHSRGPNGGTCSNNPHGKACVLKYALVEAASKISHLVHYNVQRKTAPIDEQDRRANYTFTITPMLCNLVISNHENADEDNDNDVEDETDEVTPLSQQPNSQSSIAASPQRKRARIIDENQNIASEATTEEQPQRIQTLVDTINGNGVTDCVIDRDDFIEPPVQQVINLHRTAGRPVPSHLEKNLDLLAFPHLFPRGINGLNEERKTRITPPDYFQQRLMSSDKRFAGNTDLLFYALAESDKYRVQQKIGIVCAQRNQEQGEPRENDLPAAGTDPSSYMSAIRGSAPYWAKYCGDLIAMIKQLGIPTFFLTFSFDDLNSEDAVTALWIAENGSDSESTCPTDLSFEDRKRLLNRHPIAAARHFSMRVTKFLQLLKSRSEDIFGHKLLDFSIRIEFQARGSPHAHCILWLEDVPEFNTPEGILFIDRNVSCSLKPENKDLVIKYQNHRHSATCFKRNSRTCRFQFPKQPCEETTIIPEAEIDRNGGKFLNLKRTQHEGMINNYHPLLLHILKCNMDIQPVTGEMAIAFYIAKYMSKAEPAELRLQLQNSIETIKNSDLNARQKMTRISMTLMRNREISAQEAAFRLCHLFLRQSSRLCVFIPSFRKENRLRMVRKETIGQDPKFGLNIIDRYICRPISLDHICLYEFASHYSPWVPKFRQDNDDDVAEFEEEPLEEQVGNKVILRLLNNKGQIFRRERPAVVKYPNFNIDNDKDSYYYSLVLLYLPFREENFCDVLSPVQAFNANYASFRKPTDDPVINSDLAQRIDQALLRITDFTVSENLNIDHPFDPDYEENDLEPLSAEEVFNPLPTNIIEEIKDMVARLSDEQKIGFLEVDHVLKSSQEDPIKFIVCGEGGTGKSYLIRLLSLLIRHYHTEDSLLISAPTGKAAFNVQGNTLHRSFALPVELGGVGTYHRLGSRKLEHMRKLYANIKFLFFDEFSMISYEALRMMNRRVSEIFENDEPYASKNCVMFGDLMQLKPTRGTWIFKKPERYQAEPDLWRMLKFFELKRNFRQAGLDPLLSICSNLRVGKLTQEDISILQTRLLDNHSHLKSSDFANCPWVFPKLKQVAAYNKKKTEELRQSGVTIYRLDAKDTYADGLQHGHTVPPSLVYKNETKCGGFSTTLELGKGSRVMLRRNTNVKKGLVNGALGTIVDFDWRHGYQLQEGDLPDAIFIKFDHLEDTERIPAATVDFYGKRQKRITRQQLPIIIAFAINTHKVQGDSMDQVVIDLGKDLFAKGMAYVALSRPRTMSGLGIIAIDFNKLCATASYTPCDTDALNELRRLQALLEIRRLEEINTN